uniref:Uncharacterized protein n=1 Tax=Lactuca sativa TaxID=4236 RepID=A0A9R1XNS1_LACSA|nr:hypothetical protein LSAT_V11C300112790 [Lactuca sativa]
MQQLLDVPDAIGKVIFPSSRSPHDNGESEGNNAVDILETPKELIMYMDVPSLSKSSIQDEKLLELKRNGKRGREENEVEPTLNP